MRILIASDTYYPHVNGNSYFTQRFADHLIQKGHTVLVIAPSTKFDFDRRKIHNIDVFGVPSIPVFINNFRAATPFIIKKRVEQKILTFKPDVIHVHSHLTLSSIVVDIAKKHSIPSVGTNHFMPENLVHYLHLTPVLEKKVIKFVWYPFRKVFDKLDLVTTPTKSAIALLRQNKFLKDVVEISCGIDLQRFNPKKKNPMLVKRYYPIESPILLCVGRLDKEKNVNFIINAVAKVSRKVNFHLIIAGSGAEKKYLQQLTHALGIEDRVTFAGFVPDKDLPALYASSTCFITAGSAELQSIVTMESMASGLPVLALNAVALPELVHHEENGFLFTLQSPTKLAKYIEEIFTNDNLREKMGKKSLELIAQHDIDSIIIEFENAYKEAIRRNKTPIKHRF